MAFRFRRSFRIAPGLKINVGRKSLSASVGVKGLRYTAGSAGRRVTAGLPGTGLFWTRKLEAGQGASRSRVPFWLAAAILVVVFLVAIQIATN